MRIRAFLPIKIEDKLTYNVNYEQLLPLILILYRLNWNLLVIPLMVIIG